MQSNVSLSTSRSIFSGLIIDKEIYYNNNYCNRAKSDFFGFVSCEWTEKSGWYMHTAYLILKVYCSTSEIVITINMNSKAKYLSIVFLFSVLRSANENIKYIPTKIIIIFDICFVTHASCYCNHTPHKPTPKLYFCLDFFPPFFHTLIMIWDIYIPDQQKKVYTKCTLFPEKRLLVEYIFYISGGWNQTSESVDFRTDEIQCFRHFALCLRS